MMTGVILTVKWRLGGTPDGAIWCLSEDGTSPDTILTSIKARGAN